LRSTSGESGFRVGKRVHLTHNTWRIVCDPCAHTQGTRIARQPAPTPSSGRNTGFLRCRVRQRSSSWRGSFLATSPSLHQRPAVVSTRALAPTAQSRLTLAANHRSIGGTSCCRDLCTTCTSPASASRHALYRPSSRAALPTAPSSEAPPRREQRRCASPSAPPHPSSMTCFQPRRRKLQAVGGGRRSRRQWQRRRGPADTMAHQKRVSAPHQV